MLVGDWPLLTCQSGFDMHTYVHAVPAADSDLNQNIILNCNSRVYSQYKLHVQMYMTFPATFRTYYMSIIVISNDAYFEVHIRSFDSASARSVHALTVARDV